MSAIVFLDTETTGLALDDDIWEFAAIRREEDGRESEMHLFIQHGHGHETSRCKSLPPSFRADHDARYDGQAAYEVWAAASKIATLFHDRPHVVGAVPNFDTERLALLLRQYGYEPGWHYHLIDVENLAVGFLAGEIHAEQIYGMNPRRALPRLPWDSDELSLRVGVEPAAEGERHTAMGDARWAMRVYDKVMGFVPAASLEAQQ